MQPWLTGRYMEFTVRDAIISRHWQQAVAIRYETTFDLFRIREQRVRPSALRGVLKEEMDNIISSLKYKEEQSNFQCLV